VVALSSLRPRLAQPAGLSPDREVRAAGMPGTPIARGTPGPVVLAALGDAARSVP
jgi:hypothetical protein